MGLLIALILFLAIPVIIVWVKVYQNSGKIDRLRGELKSLRRQIDSLERSKSTPKTVTPPKQETIAVEPQTHIKVEKEQPSLGEQLFSDAPIKSEIWGGISEKSSLSKNEWELFIGGKVLNRLGALALVIGFGFFLKYAFDNNIISETIRVLIGVLVGVALVAGGLRFHKKEFKIFSQGLAGSGISILYLSVYASFNYYHLISQPLAFGLMSIVTIITFMQAFYYNSMAVSLLGWAGGFLTPFLLSTGEANEVGLFSYILILDVGLIIVALRKDSWVILEALTVAATYVVFFLWYQEFYIENKLIVASLFLSGFWLLFYALNLIHVFRATRTSAELRQIVFSINIALYYLGLYLIIDPVYHEWMAFITFMISVVYFITFSVVRHQQKMFTYQQNFALLIAISLLTISIPIQFEKFITVLFWVLEAGIILWIGVKSELKFVWITGLALTLLVILDLITIQDTFSYSIVKSFNPIFNIRALTLFSVGLLFGIGAYLFSNAGIKNSNQFRIAFNSLLATLLFLFITVEIGDFFQKLELIDTSYTKDQIQFQNFLSWSLGCVILSMVIVSFGYFKNLIELIITGKIVLALGVLMSIVIGISYVPVEKFLLVFNFRSLILVGVLIGLVLHLILIKKNENLYDWLEDIYKTLQVGVIIVCLTLITGEIRDYYEKEIFYLDINSSAYLSMINLQQLLLSSSWLIVSIGLIIIGIWQRSQLIRTTSIIIFGIAILKIFLYDLSFLETLYRIFSFIGLGIVLLLASYLYQKYKHLIFEQEK
ncbi:MAG: DUF2339 domain-containing protein [Bacteroidota bacterium]